MTSTPKKAAPKKAPPKPAAPTFEPPTDHAPLPPASTEREETGHRGTSGAQLENAPDLGVSGQPAEYAPMPAAPDTSTPPEPHREPRESPPPGTERHAEIMAQAAAPAPEWAGTFAIYADPKDQGGYVLNIRLDDGTEQVKRIPSAVVALANGGGGLVGRLTGIKNLFGS
jgi:hypothetical protein